jgi:hypothetical protein
MKNVFLRLVALGIAILTAVTAALPVAHARTLTVTNTDDDGPGSLRQAIVDASPNGEIQFDPSLDGQPIVLTSGALVVHGSLTITGRGLESTIVDGNLQGAVFRLEAPWQQSGIDATISGVAITGGRPAIQTQRRSDVMLTLIDCAITQSVRGIDNGGIMDVIDCTISGNNDGRLFPSAAGIWNRGSLTLTRSTVTGNRGLRFEPNAILNYGQLTLDFSTVANNFAPNHPWIAAIENRGSATLNYSTVGQRFCVINNALFGSPTLTLNRSTCGSLSRQSELSSGGRVDLNTSTVDQLFAGVGSGVQVQNSTISGIGTDFGSVTLKNSIVGHCDTGSNVVSLGYNLSVDPDCNLTQPTDVSEGSAIDAGSCPGETTDQEGNQRPVDVPAVPNADDGCDIGALEYSPFPVVIPIHDLLLSLIGSDYELIAPLQEAIQILEDGDPTNDGEAVEHLQAFIAEVEEQRGLTLTDEDADDLVAEAQRIIRLLNFGGSSVSSFQSEPGPIAFNTTTHPFGTVLSI